MTVTNAMDIPSSSRRDDRDEDLPGGSVPGSFIQVRSVDRFSGSDTMTECSQWQNGSLNGDDPGKDDRQSRAPNLRSILHPLDVLPGEELVEADANKQFAMTRVILTNYRLCLLGYQKTAPFAISVVPTTAIETVDSKELQLIISTKYGTVIRLYAENTEVACSWFKRLTSLTGGRTRPFAVVFAEAFDDNNQSPPYLRGQPPAIGQESSIDEDFKRLEFSSDYRPSKVNADFKICDTYPETLIVPAKLQDDELADDARNFRMMGRIPAVVWRCKENNAVLLRSAQPRVSIFGWRNSADEKIFESIREIMRKRNGVEPPPIRILDARSYAAAWANRAKGGGFESAEYYNKAEVVFLGLPNIHNIRYAFHQLRTLLAQPTDDANYLQALQGTQWMTFLNSLLGAAAKCAESLIDQGESVLVHCSDGWDRTTQIVSLAKLLVDPYYRTINGFISLIRREWIDFGHKFADRHGAMGALGTVAEPNERAPVFLQWLDAVYQLFSQHKTAFEFNELYLVKLAMHAHSSLFGTFLCNSLSDAHKAWKGSFGETKKNGCSKRPPWCIFQFLNEEYEECVNQMYNREENTRLRPLLGVQHLNLWRAVYCSPPTEKAVSEPLDKDLGLISPQQSPLKENGVAPSGNNSSSNNLMEKSLVRSKSQDSISSAHNVDASGAINGAHRMSGDESFDFHNMTESVIRRSSENPPRKNAEMRDEEVRALVDVDGLLKFVDKEQDEVRRKLRLKEDEIQKLQNAEAERQRFLSERTDDSGRSMGEDGIGDDRDVQSLSSAVSDVSIVDSTEVPRHVHSGWAKSTSCTKCNVIYTHTVREHHCRNCLKSFCHECCGNYYHHPVDGRSKHDRACDDCYRAMQPAAALTNGQPSGQMTPTPPVAVTPSKLATQGPAPESPVTVFSNGSQAVMG